MAFTSGCGSSHGGACRDVCRDPVEPGQPLLDGRVARQLRRDLYAPALHVKDAVCICRAPGELVAIDRFRLGRAPYVANAAHAPHVLERLVVPAPDEIARGRCGLAQGPPLPLAELVECGRLRGHGRLL